MGSAETCLIDSSIEKFKLKLKECEHREDGKLWRKIYSAAISALEFQKANGRPRTYQELCIWSKEQDAIEKSKGIANV